MISVPVMISSTRILTFDYIFLYFYVCYYFYHFFILKNCNYIFIFLYFMVLFCFVFFLKEKIWKRLHHCVDQSHSLCEVRREERGGRREEGGDHVGSAGRRCKSTSKYVLINPLTK